MVGEIAINLSKKIDYLAADQAQQFWCDQAGHAVATIGHHLQRSFKVNVLAHPGQVSGDHIGFARLSGTTFKVTCLDPVTQLLDALGSQGSAGQHDFEAVVVGWIVAAGDRHG